MLFERRCLFTWKLYLINFVFEGLKDVSRVVPSVKCLHIELANTFQKQNLYTIYICAWN